MKKFILPIVLLLTLVFFLSPKANAQVEQDCRKIFDSAMSQCMKDYNACSDACSKKTKKPDGATYFNSGEIYQKCMKTSDCSGKSSECNEQTLANFRACGKPGEQPKATEVKKESSKTKEDEPYLLKFFGINPFEAWLRIATWSQAPRALGFFELMGGGYSETIDIDYDEGMVRIEVDSASLFGADLTMKASPRIEGAQIRLPGQYEYQSLQPNQNIPNDAYIRINTPSRFVIGEEDIEVSPFNKGGQVEFLVKKSKENESIDLIESRRDELDKMSVRLGRVVDGSSYLPVITPETEEKAWNEPSSNNESVIDVPGTKDIKRYSWDTNSGAVIRSSDWKQTEVKTPVVESGDFIFREVKFKQGEVEVRVKNDNPAKVRFSVQSPDFLEAVSSRTHYLVSYNPETKQNTVVVYEGEVEVKTTDGKTIMVAAKDGKPGMAVVTKKLSVVKLAVTGLILAAVLGSIVFILRKRFSSNLLKKKK